MRSSSLSLLLCLSLLAAGARRAECRQAGQPSGAAAQTQAQTQPGAAGQPAVKLDKEGEKVRRAVERIKIGGRITVKLKDGRKFYGAVRSIGEASFDILEVDLRQVMTFEYEDVKKAQKNYGKKNIFGQRHDPKHTAIIGIAVAVGLIALVALSIPKT